MGPPVRGEAPVHSLVDFLAFLALALEGEALDLALVFPALEREGDSLDLASRGVKSAERSQVYPDLDLDIGGQGCRGAKFGGSHPAHPERSWERSQLGQGSPLDRECHLI